MRALSAAVAGCVGLAAFCVPLASVSATADAGPTCLASSLTLADDAVNPELDAEQRANARTIVAAVIARRLPTRAAVIAVATAMQESSLRNLPYGDRDSLGLFQQRPSQDWGPSVAVMDPVQSTNRFLDALQRVPGWPALPLTVAAQSVQRSALPNAYARWEPAASRVVATLLGRPNASGGDARQLPDRAGLLVLTSRQFINAPWPPRSRGGETTTVEVDSIRETLRELRSRQRALPGAVVVELPATGSGSPHTKRFIRSVDRLTRASQVYWLADGDKVGLRHLRGGSWAGVLDVSKIATVSPASKGPAVVEHVTGSHNASVTDATAGGPGCDDGLFGYARVHVDDCTFPLPRSNPRGCQDAVRWALAQVDGPAVWYRRCLSFVARAYGHEASGVLDATTFWTSAVTRNVTDPNPPPGALVFWATRHPEGHVALSAGHGLVVSNDIGGAGTISLVSVEQVTTQWHATYLGWTPPFFPAAA